MRLHKPTRPTKLDVVLILLSATLELALLWKVVKREFQVS